MVEVWVERTRLVRVSASRFPVQAIKNKIRVNSYLLFYLVRVERIELSSQVWKTYILTTVLYPLLGWDIGIEPTTFWTTIRRSNHLS